jgi:hypothetical protein
MEASGQLLYPQGKNLQYPASRRLGWPQNWPGCFREEKSLYLVHICELISLYHINMNEYTHI